MAATPYASKRTQSGSPRHPYGSRCQNCGKKISEGANDARIRCRNCDKLNIITPTSHTVTD